MTETDVVFALVGDIRRNSRAIRQLRALTDIGCAVTALTLGPPADDQQLPTGVRLQVIEAPGSSGPRFFWQVHRRMREAALQLPACIYHASDLYTLPAMHAAARRHAGRVAYDSRELYPHVIGTAGRPWATLFWYVVEHRYVRHADAVFTVNDSIAERLADRYGIERPVVLPNVPARQPVQSSDYLRKRTGLPADPVIILYQGHIRAGRGCITLLEAVADVKNSALVFLGEGPLVPALRERMQQLAIEDRVHILPFVPPDELLPVTASADIGVVLTEDLALNHYLSLPNKLFEYCMAGLPVLASDFPEMRRVVADHDVGQLVDPSDRSAVAAALQHMVDSPADRKRWAANTPQVFDTYSWEEAAERFKHVYQRLLGASK